MDESTRKLNEALAAFDTESNALNAEARKNEERIAALRAYFTKQRDAIVLPALEQLGKTLIARSHSLNVKFDGDQVVATFTPGKFGTEKASDKPAATIRLTLDINSGAVFMAYDARTRGGSTTQGPSGNDRAIELAALTSETVLGVVSDAVTYALKP